MLEDFKIQQILIGVGKIVKVEKNWITICPTGHTEHIIIGNNLIVDYNRELVRGLYPDGRVRFYIDVETYYVIKLEILR